MESHTRKFIYLKNHQSKKRSLFSWLGPPVWLFLENHQTKCKPIEYKLNIIRYSMIVKNLIALIISKLF
jgi:hypothetical protein